MGLHLTGQLSARGANVIIVSRDLTKLQKALDFAKKNAKNPSTQRFHIISADVTSEAENERMLKEATAWNNGNVPEIVWCNAGSAAPMLFVECSIETMRKQMDLNYWAACYLAHKTLKAWLYPATPYAKDAKPEAPRHFIITSSVIAYANFAGYAPYGPAKTALRALCDSLRMEILLYNAARRSSKKGDQAPAPFDINIQSIYPGTIKSPGLEQENKTKHAVTHRIEEGDAVQTEEEAAASAIKGLENGHYMTATNWLGELMRLGSLSASPKNSLVRDMFGQWLASLVWLFVGPDLDGKVWGWGKQEGMPAFNPEKKV